MWQRTTLDIVSQQQRHCQLTVRCSVCLCWMQIKHKWLNDQILLVACVFCTRSAGISLDWPTFSSIWKKDVHLCDVSHHHNFINNSIHRECHTWSPCLLIHLYIALNLCYNLQAAICICFVWWQICTKIRRGQILFTALYVSLDTHLYFWWKLQHPEHHKCKNNQNQTSTFIHLCSQVRGHCAFSTEMCYTSCC